jgi:hypothetical protein
MTDSEQKLFLAERPRRHLHARTAVVADHTGHDWCDLLSTLA